MADYHTVNDEENKAILQKLSDDSGDAEISSVIQCYNIGSKGADIIKEMNKKHNVPTLKKCATYLGIPLDGEAKKLKAEIISDIMCRLNSLLRDLCGICSSYYNNTLQDKPPFNCLMCKQGCHIECFGVIDTAFNVLDPNQRNAFPFVCTSCQGEYKSDDDVDIDVHAQKVKKSPRKLKAPLEAAPEIVSSEITHEGLVRGDHTGESITQTVEGNIPLENSEEYEQRRRNLEEINQRVNGEDVDRRSRTAQDTTQIVHDEDIERRKARNKDPTIALCPNYKWGRCPNYEDCDYRHPARCWNWIQKGRCSYGRKCRYSHPPLCKSSLRERKCLDASCKFFHITRTQRFEDEQLKSTLHEENYQNQRYELPQEDYPYAQNHQPRRRGNQQQYRTYRSNQPPETSAAPPRQSNYQPQHSGTESTSSFSNSDVNFLVHTIKNVLQESVLKEIADIKHQLAFPPLPQGQAATSQQATSQQFSLSIVPRPPA